MGSDDDATTFPDVGPCRGTCGVLLRVEQRGQPQRRDAGGCTEYDPCGGVPQCCHNVNRGLRRRGATDFCSAFKELDVAKSSNTPAAFGAAFEAAAADMRKYAPTEIKDAAETYADVIENIGKAAQAGKMDEAGMQKALVAGMAGKAADIGKVAVWASQNCKL